MKIKKCQKCGSENIFTITLDPNCEEPEIEIECQDCGFKIRMKTQQEIDYNNFEKMMDDKDREKEEKLLEEAKRKAEEELGK